MVHRQHREGWDRPRVLELAARGKRLRWDYEPPPGEVMASSPGRVHPRPGDTRLEAFLALAKPEVGPEDVRTFAKRWGVLHHHGRPFWGRGTDDVEGWLRQARAFRAIYELAVKARRGRRRQARTEQGRGVSEWLRAEGRPVLARWPDYDRMLVGASHALRAVELGIRIEGGGSVGFSLSTGGGSLASALAWDLMLALSGTLALVPCASCGAPHRPRVTGRRSSYCEACGHVAALRSADAARRERRRRVAALYAQGTTDPEALARVVYERPSERNVATVRRQVAHLEGRSRSARPRRRKP